MSGVPSEHVALVTTSWDDGHVLDHKMAQLLDRYALPGTFYVAPQNIEFNRSDRLDAVGVRHLSERFEIGGHTLRHIRLPQLSDEVAAADIRDGRSWIEDVTGEEVSTFCYVGGCYEPRHAEMVREQGFRLARTVDRFATLPGPAMETPTTVNAYRHLVDGRAARRLAGGNLRRTARLFLNWDDLAILMFEKAVAEGGVYHLWGHSWEVDARGDWNRLERVFAHISRRSDVKYVANKDLPVMEQE